MKLAHSVFMLVMLFFAVLQWNDPDRLKWVGIYLAAALLALFITIDICKPCMRAWVIMLSIISIIMMLQLIPGVITFFQGTNYQEIFSAMTDDKPYIEEIREFLGLLIVMFYCVFVGITLHVNLKNS